MKIVSIETKCVTENPFAGLTEIEGGFEPYYATIIRYTDPSVVGRTLNVSGRGETAEEAEKEAVDLLKSREANKATDAYSKYQSDNGMYFVDC